VGGWRSPLDTTERVSVSAVWNEFCCWQWCIGHLAGHMRPVIPLWRRLPVESRAAVNALCAVLNIEFCYDTVSTASRVRSLLSSSTECRVV